MMSILLNGLLIVADKRSLLVNGSAKAVSTKNVDKVDDQYFSSTASIVGNVLEFTSKEK